MDLSSDWPYIQHIAAERLRNNKTPRHRASYGTEIEVIGAAGELAARRFLGLPEKLGTHFDGGIDISLHGLTIDVKSTRPWSKWFQIPYYKRVVADILLLMSIDVDKKTAAPFGFAWREEILAAPVNIMTLDACHALPITELHSVDELVCNVPQAHSYS